MPCPVICKSTQWVRPVNTTSQLLLGRLHVRKKTSVAKPSRPGGISRVHTASAKRGMTRPLIWGFAVQGELKYWEDYTKSGYVAGSSFTLAGEPSKPSQPSKPTQQRAPSGTAGGAMCGPFLLLRLPMPCAGHRLLWHAAQIPVHISRLNMHMLAHPHASSVHLDSDQQLHFKFQGSW